MVGAEMYRESMDVIVNDHRGFPQLFTACYDRRTGMPSKFSVSLRHKNSFNIDVEVYDCLSVQKLKEMIAARTNAHVSELILRHNGVKLTGYNKLGSYGIAPDSTLTVKLKGKGSLFANHKKDGNAMRQYKLSGNPIQGGKGQQSLINTGHEENSYFFKGEGMLAKERDQSVFAASSNTIQADDMAVHSAYGNNAPASPTDCPRRLGARTVPLPRLNKKNPEYQIEFGDSGLYFRRPKHWRLNDISTERRFSYCYFEVPRRKNCCFETPDPKGDFRQPRNPYKLERLKSTKQWQQLWNSRTDPRGAESRLPAYSSLSDPYCAKYCRSLYNMDAFEHTSKAAKESDHEFYKRREQQASNSFQRARRRSIELVEATEGRHQQHTESSRRKSLTEVEIPGGPMSHQDAAAAAAAWFASTQGAEQYGTSDGKPSMPQAHSSLYRQPTPDFQNNLTKDNNGGMGNSNEPSPPPSPPNFEIQEIPVY